MKTVKLDIPTFHIFKWAASVSLCGGKLTTPNSPSYNLGLSQDEENTFLNPNYLPYLCLDCRRLWEAL